MKKIFLLLFVGLTFFLSGCFDTTQDISINEDGSGTFRNTNDMSSLLGLAKEMGGKDAEKIDDEVMDTTMSLASQVDSIADLTPQEKELMKHGSVEIHMNLKESKFITTLHFTFSNVGEISACRQLSDKVSMQAIKQKMSESPMGSAMDGAPPISSFDDYFKTTFSKGLLTKTLDKEKYAKADSDQFLSAMKQSTSMGLPATTTYIINLPHPARKADGKNIQLSADKKTITVKVDVDDFFDDPSKLEYHVEY